MNAQVLYRKWRPQRLEEVVGQPTVTQTLRYALATGRVSHAYLFCGPKGTSKTSTARIIAKAMNCLDPTLSACTRKALSWDSRSFCILSLYSCFALRAVAEGILREEDSRRKL